MLNQWWGLCSQRTCVLQSQIKTQHSRQTLSTPLIASSQSRQLAPNQSLSPPANLEVSKKLRLRQCVPRISPAPVISVADQESTFARARAQLIFFRKQNSADPNEPHHFSTGLLLVSTPHLQLLDFSAGGKQRVSTPHNKRYSRSPLDTVESEVELLLLSSLS